GRARESTTQAAVKTSIVMKRNTVKALKPHNDFRRKAELTRKSPTISSRSIRIYIERIRFGAAMREDEPIIGIGPSKEIPHKGRLLIRGTELGPEANVSMLTLKTYRL